VNTKRIFPKSQKSELAEKISLKDSRRFAKPACMAGVLISDPNFSPL